MEPKKIAAGVAGVLGVLVLGFVGVVSMQPATMDIHRTYTVEAPAEILFALVNDFDNHPQWEPWGAKDPAMLVTNSETTAGVGAWSSWEGNDDVGSGKQTIVESLPNSKVVTSLEFIAPFEAKNTATFTFVEDGGGTTVTWRITGENDFGGKMAGMFMDIDAMIGADFEMGLQQLGVAAAAELDRRRVEDAVKLQLAHEEAAAKLAAEAEIAGEEVEEAPVAPATEEAG